MTMVMNVKTIGAGEFKARCLALLDEVAREYEVIIVTKRGKPVARLCPMAPMDKRAGQTLKASIVNETDLVSPIEAGWESAS